MPGMFLEIETLGGFFDPTKELEGEDCLELVVVLAGEELEELVEELVWEEWGLFSLSLLE